MFILFYTLLDWFNGDWDVRSCWNRQPLFNHTNNYFSNGFFQNEKYLYDYIS